MPRQGISGYELLGMELSPARRLKNSTFAQYMLVLAASLLLAGSFYSFGRYTTRLPASSEGILGTGIAEHQLLPNIPRK
jgi:hypothetical protein